MYANFPPLFHFSTFSILFSTLPLSYVPLLVLLSPLLLYYYFYPYLSLLAFFLYYFQTLSLIPLIPLFPSHTISFPLSFPPCVRVLLSRHAYLNASPSRPSILPIPSLHPVSSIVLIYFLSTFFSCTTFFLISSSCYLLVFVPRFRSYPDLVFHNFIIPLLLLLLFLQPTPFLSRFKQFPPKSQLLLSLSPIIFVHSNTLPWLCQSPSPTPVSPPPRPHSPRPNHHPFFFSALRSCLLQPVPPDPHFASPSFRS